MLSGTDPTPIAGSPCQLESDRDALRMARCENASLRARPYEVNGGANVIATERFR
jgi:hypothetical protein